MREKLKKLSPLWTVLAAVALAGAIAFAVLVGAGVSAAGARDPFPVPAASGAVRMAEDDAYFVAADAEGELSCYNKTDGTLLFSYRKPTAEDSGGGADVLNVSLYDGQVFALYSDRQVLRFAADGDGVPAGALETNYVPQKAYFPASGNLFAVYGIVGSRKEVYLLRTDFGGTPAAPVSYREYPKLDGGEYAVSSGGVETGVQGICVAEDGYVYVASDIYTVGSRRTAWKTVTNNTMSPRRSSPLFVKRKRDLRAWIWRAIFTVSTILFKRNTPCAPGRRSIPCCVRRVPFTAWAAAGSSAYVRMKECCLTSRRRVIRSSLQGGTPSFSRAAATRVISALRLRGGRRRLRGCCLCIFRCSSC